MDEELGRGPDLRVPAQPDETQAATTPEPEPSETEPVAPAKGRNARKKPAPAAIIPGGLAIDSTPQGAQVQLDGKTDPSWVTPFALTNLQPGQHSITVSKAGYSTDQRTVNVTSANRATTLVHLTQLMATLLVKSDPAGASIYVDGRDVGDLGVVLELSGLAAEAVGDPEIKALAKARSEEAISRGVFGSPWFFVDDEPFWGWDRLPMIDDWLTRGGW